MGGKGVLTAVSNVNDLIKPNVLSKEFTNYQNFDEFLINLDGTENKSKFGANAILSLSLAFYKAWSHMNFGNVFLSQGDTNLIVPVKGSTLVKQHVILRLELRNIFQSVSRTI